MHLSKRLSTVCRFYAISKNVFQIFAHLRGTRKYPLGETCLFWTMTNRQNGPSSRASDRKKFRGAHLFVHNRVQLLEISNECTHIQRRAHLRVCVLGVWTCITECSHPCVCTCCQQIPQRFVTLTRTRPPCPSYQHHDGLIRQSRNPANWILVWIWPGYRSGRWRQRAARSSCLIWY